MAIQMGCYIQDKTAEFNKRIDDAFTELDTQRNSKIHYLKGYAMYHKKERVANNKAIKEQEAENV